MNQDPGRIALYFDEELALKVRKIAKQERRSLSSQVAYLVEKGLSVIEAEANQEPNA